MTQWQAIERCAGNRRLAILRLDKTIVDPIGEESRGKGKPNRFDLRWRIL